MGNIMEDDMKSRAILIGSCLLAAALTIMGLCIYSGLSSFARGQRTVTVKGLSEKEVKADKVTWPVSVSLANNNLAALNNEIARSNNVIRQFLLDGGLTEDEITVNAPDVTDRDAEQYSSRTGGYRYVATTVVTVVSDKVDLVSELIKRQGELIGKGVAVNTSNYQYPISYEFTGLNDIKPEMIQEATKNARAAAEKFADDSDSRLGKIKTASQGQFSISDRDNYTPSVKKVRVVTTIVYYLKG